MGEESGRGIWERNLGEESGRGIWERNMGEESERHTHTLIEMGALLQATLLPYSPSTGPTVTGQSYTLSYPGRLYWAR